MKSVRPWPGNTTLIPIRPPSLEAPQSYSCGATLALATFCLRSLISSRIERGVCWWRLRVSLQVMAVSLKYAVVERERRFLVSKLPDVAHERRRIVDRYVTGTRLQLREVVTEDGAVTRKLGHKVRLGEGPREIACTSLYLDDAEWEVLSQLPAKTLRKVRHLVTRGGVTVAIDELDDGTLLAEIDDQDGAPVPVPSWLDVLRDVTDDEKWTGAQLAR